MPVAELLAQRARGGDPLGRSGQRLRRRRPGVDPALFDAGVPVFGICYGFQAMAEALGGTVKRTEGAEFGRTTATVEPDAVLFAGHAHRAAGVDVAPRRGGGPARRASR